MKKPQKLTRRHFLAASAAGSVLTMDARSYGRVFGAAERLNVAYIGVGGIASNQHIPPLAKLGAGCPAYTDTDTKRWGAAANRVRALLRTRRGALRARRP